MKLPAQLKDVIDPYGRTVSRVRFLHDRKIVFLFDDFTFLVVAANIDNSGKPWIATQYYGLEAIELLSLGWIDDDEFLRLVDEESEL